MSTKTTHTAALGALALAVTLLPWPGPTEASGADSGRALVVAPDGSGDHASIAAAVEAAADGDTVLVRPGLYSEGVVIGKDIALRGDGPVKGIVIEAPDGGPTSRTGASPGPSGEAAYALLLIDSDATVAALTLRGEGSRLHVLGGSPVLEDLLLQSARRPFAGPSRRDGSLILVAASPTIRDSTFQGGEGIRAYDRSEPLILHNEFRGGAGIAGDFGDGATIRGNEIVGDGLEGIAFLRPTTALLEDNSISGVRTGILVGGSSGKGVDPVIRGNTIGGSGTAIRLADGAAPMIEGNILVDNGTAISAFNGGSLTVAGNDLVDNDMGMAIGRSAGRVEDNTIRGGTTGVSVTNGATAALDGNAIEGAAGHGIVIFGLGTRPTLSGNRVCGNATNLFVQDGAEPVMEDNDICSDGVAEAGT